MQKALVTGATGFIGGHLLRRLVGLNYDVSILIRRNSSLENIDDVAEKVRICYFDNSYASVDAAFQDAKFDLVFHLAATGNYECLASEISEMIDSNIKFGTFILEAMRKYGCKAFINTSTYWQHYNGRKYQPICLYAATKKAFEDIIEYYAFSYGIKAITLKLYDVYGYGDHRKKLINLLLNNSVGVSLDLTKGEQLLYMLFIDDVIDGYLIAAQTVLGDAQAGHKIYNLSGGKKYSLKKVVAMISKLSGNIFNINWGKKPYFPLQIMRPDAGKILPKWQAKNSLEEGIKIILSKNHDK